MGYQFHDVDRNRITCDVSSHDDVFENDDDDEDAGDHHGRNGKSRSGDEVYSNDDGDGDGDDDDLWITFWKGGQLVRCEFSLDCNLWDFIVNLNNLNTFSS